MITTAILILLAIAGGAAIVYATRGSPTRFSYGDQIENYILPVHVPALVNLSDPAQRIFLSNKLAARDSKLLAKERNRVLLTYIRRIAHNSAVFIRWAQMVREHTSDSQAQNQAQQLMKVAIWTRLHALAAMGLLYAGSISPALSGHVQGAVRRYQALTEKQRSLVLAAEASSS